MINITENIEDDAFEAIDDLIELLEARSETDDYEVTLDDGSTFVSSNTYSDDRTSMVVSNTFRNADYKIVSVDHYKQVDGGYTCEEGSTEVWLGHEGLEPFSKKFHLSRETILAIINRMVEEDGMSNHDATILRVSL